MPASTLDRDVPRRESEESLVKSAAFIEDDSKYTRRAKKAAAKAEAIKNEIFEAERDRLRQQKSQRAAFFIWAVIAISLVLLSNAFFFIWYMSATGGSPSEPVLISFMSTSLVEVIGLGYIIARSLFQAPGDEANGSKASMKSRETTRS